jgi:hypothetical protein
MKKKLEEAKVGDQVLIRLHLSKDRVGVISKITDTQITVGSERYMKRNGYKVGSGKWSREWISLASPEDAQEVRDAREHDALVQKIGKALSKQRLITLQCINTQMRYDE